MGILQSRKGRVMIIAVLIGVIGMVIAASGVVEGDSVDTAMVVSSGFLIAAGIASYIFGVAIEDAAAKNGDWLKDAGITLDVGVLDDIIENTVETVANLLVEAFLDGQLTDEQIERIKDVIPGFADWVADVVTGEDEDPPPEV